MFKHLIILIVVSMLIGEVTFASEDKATEQYSLEAVSYALGVQYIQRYQFANMNINSESFAEAVEDIQNNNNLKYQHNEIQNILSSHFKKLKANIETNREVRLKELQDDAAITLSELAKKENIDSLDNGILYEVLKRGDGQQVTSTDSVLMNYKATLIDGKLIDDTGEPVKKIEVNVATVNPALSSILPEMKQGDKWKFFIPPALAYGEQGIPGRVMPYSVVIYEIELISIQKKDS